MRRLPLLIVTDHEGGRSYHVHQSASGTVRLEVAGEFQTPWKEFEHHRPSPLVRRGVPAYGSWEGEELERTRFCARALATWIREQLHDQTVDQPVKILTPVRLLGPLQEQLEGTLLGPVLLSAGEFRTMPQARLAGHPEVSQWLHSEMTEH